MATSTKSLNGNTSATSADLADQIETLRNDLSMLTNTIAEIGIAKGEDAVTAAKSKAADVKATAADSAETARLQAMELQGQANDFIKNQPVTALGIAAGIGFLIGFMGSRK